MSFDILPGETPIDPSGLKNRGSITTRAELNLAEAENIRPVLVKYLSQKPSKRSAPFDYAWVLRLHREMFGKVWLWAGVTRQRDLNLGVPWLQVEPMLYALLDDLRCWEPASVDLIDQAVMLHHRAVYIHPFEGGNGRWSRMLANVWLKQHDGSPVTWHEDSLGAVSPFRDEYIRAVQAADDGDYDPLKALHVRYTLRP